MYDVNVWLREDFRKRELHEIFIGVIIFDSGAPFLSFLVVSFLYINMMRRVVIISDLSETDVRTSENVLGGES